MGKIPNITEEKKRAIKRSSAFSLPNNPTGAGFKPDDIRRALYEPIVNATNSALAEIDRVINQINALTNKALADVDVIVNVSEGVCFGTNGLVYSIRTESAEIIGFALIGSNKAITGELIIPSYIYYGDLYYPVIEVAEASFKGFTSITRIVVPGTVKEIYADAFTECTSLAEAYFDGETKIYENSFDSQVIITVPNRFKTSYQYSGFKGTIKLYQELYDKLDRIEKSNNGEYAYAIVNGQQTTKVISPLVEKSAIVSRDPTGRTSFPYPYLGNEPATKDYVDDNNVYKFTYEMQDDYKVKLSLENKKGDTIGEVEIDLPLESMVVGASYANGILTLQLKNNDDSSIGNTVDVNISDIIDGLVNETDFNEVKNRVEDLHNNFDRKAKFSITKSHLEETATMDINTINNIFDLLDASSSKYPVNYAFVCLSGEITYAKIEGYSKLDGDITATRDTVLEPNKTYFYNNYRFSTSNKTAFEDTIEEIRDNTESALKSATESNKVYEELNNLKGKVGGYAVLEDVDGKAVIPSAHINQVDVKEYIKITDEDELNYIDAQKGDVAVLVETVTEIATGDDGEEITSTYEAITKSWLLLGIENGVREWKIYGTSYATNAGYSTYANNAGNAQKINGIFVQQMKQSQYQNLAVKPMGICITTIGE